MGNQNILVVEDDQVLAKVINEELTEAGFNVDLQTNGRAGLESAQQNAPDLVLLDLLMPEMHGFEVLEELKRSPATKEIPVIILTMLGSDEDIKKGLKLGANDYVVKSQHPVGEIVEKVQSFFGQESHPEAKTGGESLGGTPAAAPQQPPQPQEQPSEGSVGGGSDDVPPPRE